jgi:hypothetical protein
MDHGPWGRAPQRTSTGSLILGGIGLFIIATLAGTGVGWLNATTRNDNLSVTQSSAPTAASTNLTDPPATATNQPSDSPTPSPTPSEPTQEELEQEAEAALETQAATDRHHVNLRGQWVAQLSSKYVGIHDPRQTTASGSQTFYAVDILAEHQNLRDKVGDGYDVRLLRGQDFSPGLTHNGDTFWFTFAFGNFESRHEVDSFCQAAFPSLTGEDLKNSCLPRRIRP